MYKTGDLIFYGNTGVCAITEVSQQKFSAASKGELYYTLEPLYQKCKIHIPVHNDKVFIRSIISKEEAIRLIDTIPYIQAEPYHNKAMGQLSQYYEGWFKRHDCQDMIQLTMSIHLKKLELEGQKRKFGVIDGKFMKRAEEMLFGELSAALGIAKEDVPDYIAARMEELENIG